MQAIREPISKSWRGEESAVAAVLVSISQTCRFLPRRLCHEGGASKFARHVVSFDCRAAENCFPVKSTGRSQIVGAESSSRMAELKRFTGPLQRRTLCL